MYDRSCVSFWVEAAATEASFLGHCCLPSTVKSRIFGGLLPWCAQPHSIVIPARRPPPAPPSMFIWAILRRRRHRWGSKSPYLGRASDPSMTTIGIRDHLSFIYCKWSVCPPVPPPSNHDVLSFDNQPWHDVDGAASVAQIPHERHCMQMFPDLVFTLSIYSSRSKVLEVVKMFSCSRSDIGSGVAAEGRSHTGDGIHYPNPYTWEYRRCGGGRLFWPGMLFRRTTSHR